MSTTSTRSWRSRGIKNVNKSKRYVASFWIMSVSKWVKTPTRVTSCSYCTRLCLSSSLARVKFKGQKALKKQFSAKLKSRPRITRGEDIIARRTVMNVATSAGHREKSATVAVTALANIEGHHPPAVAD